MTFNQSFSVQENIYSNTDDVVDVLSVGLFYTDPAGKCTYVNQKWLEISGMTMDDALGDGWARAIHTDDQDRVYSEWNDSVSNDRAFSLEYRFMQPDGSITWVIGQANKHLDQYGNVLGYIGTITDITQRKNIEDALHEIAKGFSVTSSADFFSTFAQHLGDLLDTDFVVVSEIINDTNDLVKSVVVYHRGEFLDQVEYSLQGTPCETIFGKTVKGYKCGIQEQFPGFELLKALNVDGYVGAPLFDSTGKPIGIIATLSLKAIEDVKLSENILQIYAVRASAELERKRKEEVLKNINKELEFKQFTLEHISESIFWTDENAKLQDVNDAACQSLGYTRDELLQLSIPDIDDTVSIGGWKKHWEETKNKGGKKVFESVHTTKDGKSFPVEINVNHIEYDGKAYHCSIVRNISDRKANEREREVNLSLKNAIFEATADGIVVTNQDKLFTSYNQNFIKLWGFEDINLLDKSYESRIRLMTDKLKYPDSFKVRIKEIYEAPEEDTFDIIELKDGTIMERVSRPQRLDGKVVGRVWNFRDITEKHKLSEQLSYQATHDPLTGLVNRREFEKRLDRMLKSIDANTEHVMCYMDLDNFKQINDVCGHLAGDYLLKQISDIFQQQLRARDTLARIGGDEFGLIMEHCTIQQGERIAKNLIHLISESDFKWEEQSFNIGVSIGIVKIDNSCTDMLDLIKHADVACYAAKKSGRNCIHTHHI
jgi:diguanylate cyclase (GGDEF)-like protein/PAS domain S-box-containing protein